MKNRKIFLRIWGSFLYKKWKKFFFSIFIFFHVKPCLLSTLSFWYHISFLEIFFGGIGYSWSSAVHLAKNNWFQWVLGFRPNFSLCRPLVRVTTKKKWNLQQGNWNFGCGVWSGARIQKSKKKFQKISRLRKMTNFDISGTYPSNSLVWKLKAHKKYCIILPYIRWNAKFPKPKNLNITFDHKRRSFRKSFRKRKGPEEKSVLNFE